MKTNTTIGTYLKNLRHQHKYTQAYIASQLNIIRQTYSHYETGRIFPPTDVLIALTHIYQISMDSFFEPDEQKKEIAKSQSFTTESKDQALPKFDASSLLFDRSKITKESELLNLFRIIEERDQDDIIDFLKAKASRYRNAHFYA